MVFSATFFIHCYRRNLQYVRKREQNILFSNVTEITMHCLENWSLKQKWYCIPRLNYPMPKHPFLKWVKTIMVCLRAAVESVVHSKAVFVRCTNSKANCGRNILNNSRSHCQLKVFKPGTRAFFSKEIHFLFSQYLQL